MSGAGHGGDAGMIAALDRLLDKVDDVHAQHRISNVLLERMDATFQRLVSIVEREADIAQHGAHDVPGTEIGDGADRTPGRGMEPGSGVDDPVAGKARPGPSDDDPRATRRQRGPTRSRRPPRPFTEPSFFENGETLPESGADAGSRIAAGDPPDGTAEDAEDDRARDQPPGPDAVGEHNALEGAGEQAPPDDDFSTTIRAYLDGTFETTDDAGKQSESEPAVAPDAADDKAREISRLGAELRDEKARCAALEKALLLLAGRRG